MDTVVRRCSLHLRVFYLLHFLNSDNMNIQHIKTFVKWKEIKLFPGYYISNTGLFRIGKTISRTELKKKSNYQYVIMINKVANIRHRTDIHQIVWNHFGDRPKPIGWEIHHDDLNINNNHIDNLRLIPRSEHILLHKTSGENSKVVKKSA